MAGRNIQDMLGGVIAILIGAPFFIKSFDYGIGTSNGMLPGYFPAMASGMLILLGVAVTIKSFFSVGRIEDVAWRPLLAIVLSMVAFMLFVKWFGLLPGTAAAVVVSTVATNEARLIPTLILAAVVTALIWIIFGLMLGLPIPMYRGFA